MEKKDLTLLDLKEKKKNTKKVKEETTEKIEKAKDLDNQEEDLEIITKITINKEKFMFPKKKPVLNNELNSLVLFLFQNIQKNTYNIHFKN